MSIAERKYRKLSIWSLELDLSFPYMQLKLSNAFPEGQNELLKYESGIPTIHHIDATQLESIDPATHVYLAWQGFNEVGKAAVAKLFKRSSTAKYVTVVQYCKLGFSSKPKEPQMLMQMIDMGFGNLQLVKERMDVPLAGNHSMSGFTFMKSEPSRARAGQSSKTLLDLKPFRLEY